MDKCFQNMELSGDRIVIVTDIGCSGLFDTYFHTHTFHGLHGRALTYATGLKMAGPGLNVVVIMGDGGLGIGGAHVLSWTLRLTTDRGRAAIEEVFDLRPGAILTDLDLTRPIYTPTSAYGHFGRPGFTWEETPRVEALAAAAGA